MNSKDSKIYVSVEESLQCNKILKKNYLLYFNQGKKH